MHSSASQVNIIYQRLGIMPADLAAFCQRWDIAELSLFGSILRNDFSASSDVDILISYFPQKTKGLLALVRIKDELETLIGREVDVMTKQSIDQSRNWLRRRHILDSAQVVYVA
ncbi:MAG: DNA polymerase subunit beta [Leptolyngbya sp. SIOISBB]|nr:DNA polymerase subunit beta [Leptolyngbya sp. SIOISBB]